MSETTITAWTVPPQVRPQDDTTRYLCAAAHLDSGYADNAIREFLTEPTRPLPHSPGFDPARVLVEAIASRGRRKLRDGILAVLFGLFVWASGPSLLLFAWLALAVVLVIPSIWRTAINVALKAAVVAVLGAFTLAGLLLYLIGTIDPETTEDFTGGYYSDYYGPPPGDEEAWFYVSIALVVLMLAILVTDRLVVRSLLVDRFGYRARNRPPADPFTAERPLLGLCPPRFLRQLHRYRDAEQTPQGTVPLFVHRGYNPFVGAGLHRESWSMALPLERLPEDRKPDGSPFDELTTPLLYERVRAAMAVLQESESLSPDRRLRELSIREAVFASSAELIDHVNQPESVVYLRGLDSAPERHLPPGEVTALRQQPREWARYYLCFQVETWDRDLVMSSFLHAAADASTLYLEWTPCVLPPVRDRYRAVDKLPSGVIAPIGQALLRLARLPVTVWGRARHTLEWIQPLRQDRGLINPDAYGSLRTLREMAAADEVDSYFQLVDVERYEKILHSRLMPAISRILRDCGYSPASFERQAATVIHKEITIHGDNYAPINTGANSGSMDGANVQSAPAKGD
ncbi:MULTISPECIES: hypothetical protein [Amycolatopsis]|uniref:hypothetical protein n=1 Tax=Amycolatopsis TaxID=1813 RepID=UPI000B8A7122|nr:MULTISPECIES: hypothetical protein [Amycolatopsis]OXM73262.1 hypothetical protein CF166_10785 [Amycolatopsis sp. KNN50.9b]